MTVAVLQMQHWPGNMSTPPSQKRIKPAKDGLAALAPRYQAWVGEVLGRAETKENKTVTVPRTRLPPRSRFGCWTCRTRKVKCDEARPECTPCSRLGHECDYNPRLSFKDDTPRVIEKISGGTDGSGPVWNPRPAKKRRLNSSQDDLLPPFASLTNDEDRERKAEFRKPGTFHVVVNPESFADFEDYREKSHDESFLSTNLIRSRSKSIRSPNAPFGGSSFQLVDRSTSSTQATSDPDVVVLKVFEDDSRRITPSPSGLSTVRGRSSRASTFSNSSTLSLAASVSVAYQHRSPKLYSYDDSPLMRMASSDGRDRQIINFYKNFIQRHLLQIHRDTLGAPFETGSISSADVLERQAANFLPLYHALMAFCALSLSQRSGNNRSIRALALQHYQQTLPSLQASLSADSDLASDGVFLTHFMLLLYEIAAGEPYGMSLWQQHITQLLRIILLRRQLYGREPYSFIVWWVANIDTHVVLSGMGNGEFVESMLQHNLLPSGLEADDYHFPATSIPAATPTHSSIPDPLYSTLPSALAFHRRISTLAAQLGLLGRDLRAEEQRDPANGNLAVLTGRQQRVANFQDLLRRTWAAQEHASVSGGYSNLLVPIGSRGLFEHSFALHRALTIYAHTSLPHSTLPSTSSTSPFTHPSVLAAATDILHLARAIISASHLERRFIVFPLFMAGVVFSARSTKDNERFGRGRERELGEVRALLARLEDEGGAKGKGSGGAGGLLGEVCRRGEREGRGSGRGSLGGSGLGIQGWEQIQRQYQGWGIDGGGVAGSGIEADGGVGEVGDGVDWVALVQELGLQAVNCRL